MVNIANIALARHYYSTDVLKIPQGAPLPLRGCLTQSVSCICREMRVSQPARCLALTSAAGDGAM